MRIWSTPGSLDDARSRTAVDLRLDTERQEARNVERDHEGP